MRVLSLGWGVQSFTLAAMAALGDVEPIDYALHADTLHEQKATYDFAQRFAPWLAEHGVKVVTVNNPTGGVFEILKKPGQTHVPFFTLDIHGSKGQLNRSCTQRWKIVPMRRWLQANRNGQRVEQWIGISLDEYQRMHDSDVKYITHRWPLIEKKMSRDDCAEYLLSHGLEIPPKSACTFCPFHSSAEWRRILSNESDAKEAFAVDSAFRHVRASAKNPVDVFVHPSCRPLEKIDFRTLKQKGQLSLWDNECAGICGV